MAGTIVADTLQADSTSTLVLKNGVANTPPTIQDSSGTQIGTFCRAWVNFNGTSASPITPRASFNVSSITKSGTALYTISFTTAIADANYAVVANGGTAGSTSAGAVITSCNPVNSSSCFVNTRSGANADNAYDTVQIAVFR